MKAAAIEYHVLSACIGCPVLPAECCVRSTADAVLLWFGQLLTWHWHHLCRCKRCLWPNLVQIWQFWTTTVLHIFLQALIHAHISVHDSSTWDPVHVPAIPGGCPFIKGYAESLSLFLSTCQFSHDKLADPVAFTLHQMLYFVCRIWQTGKS